MEDVKPIDTMCYFFWRPDLWKAREYRLLFGRGGQEVDPPPASFKLSAKEFVAQMDKAGYDKVFISAPKMWSNWDKKLLWDINIDELYENVKDYPDRLLPVVSYDPFRIEDSVREIEKAVKDYGVKLCYFHCLGQGLAANDKRLYPCYAKCSEMGIPVAMQVGHSAEIMPSGGGRPIYLDDVALDFPNLTIIGSHTGWPWVEEMVAMAMKHANVYADIAAWPPSLLPRMMAPLFMFMPTREGQRKVIYGTNMVPVPTLSEVLKQRKEQFLALELKDDVKRMIMRENAIRIFKL